MVVGQSAFPRHIHGFSHNVFAKGGTPNTLFTSPLTPRTLLHPHQRPQTRPKLHHPNRNTHHPHLLPACPQALTGRVHIPTHRFPSPCPCPSLTPSPTRPPSPHSQPPSRCCYTTSPTLPIPKMSKYLSAKRVTSSATSGASAVVPNLGGEKPCLLFRVFHVPNVSIYRKSHETAPYLPSPTPPAFPLDFTQLLQATTANPASRPRLRLSARAQVRPSFSLEGKKEVGVVEEEEEGWDVVDGGEGGSDLGL